MVILEEETFKKFGYYPRDLKPKSHKRIIVACDICGKIRENNKSAYRAICQSCARRSENLSEKTKQMRRESLTGENNYSWKPRIKTVCEICGNEFMAKDYIIKKGEGKYCSLKCKNIAQSKNFTGKNSPKWKGGPIKCTCQICGKTFEVCHAEIKNGRGKYCSRACYAIALKKKQQGYNNPNWKGGISFEPYCEKFDENFREYIRAKFGRVCFLCGKTEEENGRKLSVHHVSYDKACGCAKTEEDKKADDASCQFVPLCISCHSKVHHDREKWQKFFIDKMRNCLTGWYI